MLLTERDYLKVIRRDHLRALVDGDGSIRAAAEEAAMQEAAGYLARARFDVAAIFLAIPDWDASAQYADGDHVHFSPPAWQAAVYPQGAQVAFDFPDGTWVAVATRATTANESPASTPSAWTRLEPLAGIWKAVATPVPGDVPLAGGGDWMQSDPRHRLLVMYLTDITLWHLLSRLDPSAVPEIRRTRYEQALDWLTAVSKHQVSDPWLPLLSDPETPPIGGFHMSSRPRNDFTL